MNPDKTLLEEDQPPSPLFDWRALLPVHPAADAYPKVPHERLVEIGESIRRNGLEFPILVNAKGNPGNPDVFELFDGVTRLDSMVAVGIKFEIERFRLGYDCYSLRLVIPDIPTEGAKTIKIYHNLDDAEIVAKIESANLHRRHLEPEQYHARLEASHARIEAAIKQNPEKSDRAIGEETGHDHKTIGSVRRKMEDVGSIPHVETRTDTKGRQQPAKRSRSPRHKCWQCYALAPVGEVQKRNYAACGKADVWLHDACVAAFEAQLERDRQEFADDEPTASDNPPSTGNGAGAEPTKEESLAAKIQLEWREAETAFENLTSHAVTQIAAAIPHENHKEAAARATEYANLFQALAAQLKPKEKGPRMRKCPMCKGTGKVVDR